MSDGSRVDPARIEAALRSDPMVAHAAVYGHGRGSLAAMVALNPLVVSDWAAEHGKSAASFTELTTDPDLIQTVALSIAYANRDLERFERVRSFTVAGEQWRLGSNLVEPDGSPNRVAIAARYAPDLAAMFGGEMPEIPSAGAAADDRPAVDPTPSYSTILRPARPLARKGPIDTTPEIPPREPEPALPADAGLPTEPVRPTIRIGEGDFGGDPSGELRGPVWDSGSSRSADGDGVDGTDAYDRQYQEPDESLDWDARWTEGQPPRRWWWALLVAVVVVAAGALVYRVIDDRNSNSASDETEFVDDTIGPDITDPMLEDPDAVDSTPPPIVTENLRQIVEGTENLTTFLTAVKAAGLEAELEGVGPYTVFAPTDEAFAKLPPGTLEVLLADKTLLAKVLRHHMFDGAINAENLTDGNLAARDGTTVVISIATDVTLDNTVRPVDTDIPALNGVIHTIDGVLLPPDVTAAQITPTTTTTLPDAPVFTIYFDSGEVGVNREARKIIEQAAEIIKALPEDSVVVITGYTAKIGSTARRNYLASWRAKNTISALKKAGATNVTYETKLVTDLPRDGDVEKARRAEIALPSRSAAATSTSASTTSSS